MLTAELDNVSVEHFAPPPCFYLAIYHDLPISYQQLGFAASGNEALELQYLVELYRLPVYFYDSHE